jgi:glycosyltransferase involved in cell wall biosynthesis
MRIAFTCEPDAYLTEGRTMMGRRSAGAAFLRAAVEAMPPDQPFVLFGGKRSGAAEIAKAIDAVMPGRQIQWIAGNRTDQLKQVGTLFRLDPSLGADARLRLRENPLAYSLCGITHTLSSLRAQEIITGYVTEPMMEWDALICTSTAALDVVRTSIEAAIDYYRWRMGGDVRPDLPMFPVIPLGVHAATFAPSASRRASARARLGLTKDDVVVLYAGRLSFATKAHPYPMYRAVEAVIRRTGKRLVLVQAGQSANASADDAVRSAAGKYAPAARHIFIDGADDDQYFDAFQAGDIFMSLADNVQETFGITPIEAMAAALPVIVSDWNGYKDTVRQGIDGFRIASWAPRPGAGAELAQRFEVDKAYEPFCARVAAAVSFDHEELADRLEMLVSDPDLRRRMGEAGRLRAERDYDWGGIYRRYVELWAEQTRRRSKGVLSAAQKIATRPAMHPGHLDGYHVFRTYPTHLMESDTVVSPVPDSTGRTRTTVLGEVLFAHIELSAEQARRLIAVVDEGPILLGDLGKAMGMTDAAVAVLAGKLAKMDIVRLSRSEAAGS